MLQSLDTHWREHLSALDHLRQGIHLRGYAQKQPKQGNLGRGPSELFESCSTPCAPDVMILMTGADPHRGAAHGKAETPPSRSRTWG